jgi:hypothetical protein
MMRKNLIEVLVLVVLATALYSCIVAPPPKPLADGSCPGRYFNERVDKVSVHFYRLAGKTETLAFHAEVQPRTSMVIGLTAGRYNVMSQDANGIVFGRSEILVAVPGSTLYECAPPELGVEQKEILYWWVKAGEEKK